MKKLILTFALIMSGMLLEIQGQSLIISEQSEPLAILMKHNGGGTSQDIVNTLVKRLSTGNNSPLNTTEFVFVADEFSRITLSGEQQLNVYYALKKMLVKGATSYRNFDVSKFLIPSAVTGMISRTKNGTKLDHMGYVEVPLSGDPAPFADYTVIDSSGQIRKNQFKVTLRDFIYSREQQDEFLEFADLVDSYYSSGDELEQMYAELQTIDPGDLDHIEDQRNRLQTIQAGMATINGREFSKRLGLKAQSDPIKLLAKIRELEGLIAVKEEEIGATMANMAPMYHQRGLEALRSGMPDQAISDFNRALEFDPRYAPAHLELAKLDQQAGLIQESKGRVEDLLLNMQPDPQTRRDALTLAETIANGFVSAAIQANQIGQYDAAILNLDEGRNMAARIPELTASGVFDREYRVAYNGIYQDHLTDAQEGLGQGRLAEAEANVNKALQFQEMHPNFIPSNEEATELRDKIMQEKYQQLVTRGRGAQSLGNHREALDALEAAKAMEGNFGIAKNPLIFPMMRQSAKPLMLELAEKGNQLAGDNQLSEARKLIPEITDLREKYGFQKDTEVEAVLADLKASIFSQECANAQAEYDGLLSEARELEKQKEYIKADAVYFDAIAFLHANAACGLSDAQAKAERDRIKDAVEYQQSLFQVDEDIRTGDYRVALERYTEAAKFFAANDLGKFGLAHTPTLEFVLGQRSNGFLYFMAMDYTDKKDFESAIQLVDKLSLRKYAKSQLKPLMKRIGTDLAIRDHEEGQNVADPKAQGMSYINGNKKLKRIAKAYKKQWKKM